MTDTVPDLYDLPDVITAAVRRQAADRDPAHEDFYAWGYVLSELTARVQDAARLLGRQVAAYGDRRQLRDDAGTDPADRLAEAAALLDEVAAAAGSANNAARLYHSSVGHIAVADDPESAE
jgi:hypothetical protein